MKPECRPSIPLQRGWQKAQGMPDIRDSVSSPEALHQSCRQQGQSVEDECKAVQEIQEHGFRRFGITS